MKPFFLLVFTNTLLIGLTAQTFPYAFSTFNDPYMDLSAPISISNSDVWDDPFYITSTGFDCTLFETITNTLGIISPGSQVVNLNEANPDTVQLMAPYFSDIMTANDSDAVSPISYQLEGPPGNAIFKLEWKNVGFYGEQQASNTFLNTTNFQIWLYQNSSVIEFRYGPNTIKSGMLIHYFDSGPLVFLGKNVAFDGSGWEGLWALGGDPQNPTISPVESGMQPLASQALNSEPESGTVYRFAPMSMETNETNYEGFLNAWPTQTSDFITVAIKPAQHWCIYDGTGRLVLERTATDNQERVDVSSWPIGTYCITSRGYKTVRFIKY